MSTAQSLALALIHLLALAALLVPSLKGLYALLVLHFISGGLGISLGYHRLLCHKSFEASLAMRRFFAFCGTLAMQLGPLSWVAVHRAHHRFEDEVGDPHASARGFHWSHWKWAVHRAPNGFRFRDLKSQVPDLARDPFMVFLEKYGLHMNGLLFMAAIAVLGWEAALWAFPLRIVLVWHTTWAVNSIAHGAGWAAPRPPRQSARNLTWLALISYGEGLHRNHHQYPSRPTYQRRPWDPDLGWFMLRALAAVGAVRFHKTKRAR